MNLKRCYIGVLIAVVGIIFALLQPPIENYCSNTVSPILYNLGVTMITASIVVIIIGLIDKEKK